MNLSQATGLMSLVSALKWFGIPVSMAMLAYSVCMLLEVKRPLGIVLLVFFVSLAIVIGVLLVGWAGKKSKERGLESSVAGAGGADHRAEVEALRAKWKESLETLRRSGLGGGGGASLAALPWYVIIGEPASGKSTLLRQSGIDFPIGDAALRGLQGTRNCDWWFSNVGIFLDTAGRYMSDESGEEWRKFLDLVRRQRTGAPVNGVIIAVPAPDLVSRDAAALDAEARRIRTRLDELIDRLGINFPVWVVLTKVDLLGGFSEFFGRVDAQARQRLMGWTLGPTEGMRFDRGQFDAQYEGMVERLYEMRPQMLESASLRQRHVAFGFPDEVAALGQPLGLMLQRLFEPNVFQETPFFRGLSVTSATQEGTPLQQAVARVRERFGGSAEADPEPTALVKHAFFVEDLVKDRIVADRDMTWTTKTEMQRGRLKRIGLNLMGCSLPVLLLLAFVGNWKRADLDLRTVTGSVEKVKTLKPVDAAHELCEARQAVKTGKLKNFGLNAHWMLRKAIHDEEKFLLHRGFLEPLMEGYRDRFHASTGDFSVLVGSYREFRAVAEAFRKISPGYEPPPAPPAPAPGKDAPKEGAGEAPKGAAAPPAPPPVGDDGIRTGCRPPLEYLGDAEQRAVAALWDFFTKNGLADPEGREARDLFKERVLGPVSRVGMSKFSYVLPTSRDPDGEVYDPAADMAKVEKAFRESLVEFSAKLNEEMKRTGPLLARRIEGFQSRCAETSRVLAEGHGGTEEALELVRALRKSALGDSGDAGGGPAMDLSGVARGIKELEDSGLLPKEDITAALAGIDRARLDSMVSGKGQGGVDPRKLVALGAVADALLELDRNSSSMALAGDEMALPANLEQARGGIEARVKKEQDAWTDRVRPSLLVLAGMDASSFLALPNNEPRRVVEALSMALWRDALYQRFFDTTDAGGYRSLVGKTVAKLSREASTSTEPVYTIDRLRELATELFSAVEFLTRSDPPGGIQVREAMKGTSLKAFQDAVAAARSYWADECLSASEEFTRRDAFSAQKYLLESWAEERSKLFKFSERLKKHLRVDWVPAGVVPGRALTEGRPAADGLRQSFQFFWDGYPEVRGSLQRLALCHQRAREARSSGDAKELLASVNDVKEGFATTGDRSWNATLEAIKTKLPPELGRLSADVDRAVGLVLADLQSNIDGWFGDRWAELRDSVARALASPGPGGTLDFSPDYRAFQKALREWFGRDLGGSVGRVRVAPAYREFARQIDFFETERAALDKEGVAVTFVAKQVPQKAQGFPFMVMEYTFKGGDPLRATPFTPGGSSSLPLTWKPGEAQSLKIFLLDPARQNPKLFRSWTGPDCVSRAVVDAKRSGSTLVWESQVPELAGDTVAYDVQCAADGLERLIRFSKASEKPAPPEKCVESAAKE